MKRDWDDLTVRNAFLGAVDEVAPIDIVGGKKSFDLEANMGAADNENIEVNGKTVATDPAFDALSRSTANVMEQLNEIRDETRQQAKRWSLLSMIMSLIGFLLIGAGVVMILSDATTSAVITAVSGIVTTGIGALFFAQSREANKRVDAILARLNQSQEILTLVQIANTLESEEERNRLKTEIMRKALETGTI